MYNWYLDEEKYKKTDPEGYKLWRLEQMLNYGTDGEKLDEAEVKRVWPKIKENLDPDRKKTIEFFLWQKPWRKEKGLLPDRSNFWQWYFKSRTS